MQPSSKPVVASYFMGSLLLGSLRGFQIVQLMGLDFILVMLDSCILASVYYAQHHLLLLGASNIQGNLIIFQKKM